MARSSGRQIGTKVSMDSRLSFGDPDEIANRDKVGFQNRETRFNQPGPKDRGGSLAKPPHTVRSGNFKYNRPVS